MIKRNGILKTGMVLLGATLIMTGCSGDAPKDKAEDEKPAVSQEVEKDSGIEVTDLDWSIQPKLGIIKGDYYRAEERFRQGHLGVLEVVKDEEELVHIEFNEQTRSNYYHRYFQDVPKRMSEYNFDMGEKKGAAWIQSVLAAEAQMLKEQKIDGEVETISGASNSINQSMLPLAEKLNLELGTKSGQYYYSIAEKLDGGLTGVLKVVLEDKKIVNVRYDEIFADSPEEIENKNLKQFYRQSKYDSVEYEEPSRIGFNVQMDALNEKVLETQDLLDISELPSTDESGNYASSGFTIRNGSWDNYLKLAEELLEEMKQDDKF